MTDEALPERESVLALLLTHARNPQLPEVLGALARQVCGPTRLIVAVRGADRQVQASVDLLTFAFPVEVRTVDSAMTLGQAVNELAGGDEKWLWLIHGDSAPQPECLDELLRFGEASAKVGAVGPKQVAWENPRRLIEVGIRATRTARRIPEIPENELDQGQYDWREDILAVGTAGMLVRRAALAQIGGFDPFFGPFGDGLELSRRLWLGGWRVAVEPNAVIRHARGSFEGVERASFGQRRGAQLYNALLSAPPVLWLFMLLGYLLLAPVRSLARIVTKEGRLASGELHGAIIPLAHLPALMAGRRRVRRAKRAPASVIRSLESTARDLSKERRELRRQRREAIQLVDRPDPIVLRERRQWRKSTRNWAIAALVVPTVVAVAALLPLVGEGVLSGGALLTDSWTSSELLSAATNWWLPSGLGQSTQIDALWILLIPLVAISELFGGNLGWVATAIVITAAPLAALTAYLCAGRFTHSPQIRFIGALLWGFAPPLLAAVNEGQVAAAIWHIVFPIVLAGVVEYWRRGSSSALGIASLAVAFASAAAPGTLVVALAVAVVGLIFRRPRAGWLWLPVPALAVSFPLLTELASIPEGWRVLLSTVGNPVAVTPSWLGLVTLDPSSSVSLERVGGYSAGEWIGAVALLVILIAALLCLAKKRNWISIRMGWFLVPIGLAWARLSSISLVATSAEGANTLPVTAWAGTGLSLACAGLWIVIVSGGDGLRTSLSRYSFGFRHVVVLGAVALTALSTLALGGTWAVQSLRGESSALHSVTSERVPALATTAQVSADRSRVLALIPTQDGVRAQIWRGSGRQLHEVSLVGEYRALRVAQGIDSDAAQSATLQAVTNLVSGGDVADELADLNVSFVLIPASDSSISEQARSVLVSELNVSGSLSFITENASGAFWRVESADPIARARIVGSNVESLASGIFSVDTDVAAGSGGTLTLSERADSGWRAYLNGVALESSGQSWNQQWELPSTGGHLVVTRSSGERWVAYLQLAILIAAVVMAVPLRKRKQVRE